MDGMTLEWFGATTYRLRAYGLTIFLDTWLERPSILPQYLTIDEVTEADYIFISHAHFDHLPGADRLAIKTGAIVIGNGEAVNQLRNAQVPEHQLMPVAGGERIPLFTRETWNAALSGTIPLENGPPGAPPKPHHSQAAFSVHVWPSLHCLMPGSHADIPEVMDTGKVYTGEAHPYVCTLDITHGMHYGLLRLNELVPKDIRDPGMQSFIEYIADRKRNVFSAFDGGQLAFNILLPSTTIFWSAHLGAYDSILRNMEPKPDIAILAIAGRANLNGRPYDGSAAQFAVEQLRWLNEPKYVIWCLHDESPIKPWCCDGTPATDLVHQCTSSTVLTLEPGKSTAFGK